MPSIFLFDKMKHYAFLCLGTNNTLPGWQR